MNQENIKQFLKQLGEIEIKEKEPLRRHTTFKIGGPADFFISVGNKESLKKLLLFSFDSKLPVFMIGGGSNLLVSDQGINGLVLHLDGEFNIIKETQADGSVICGAGIPFTKLIAEAAENGLGGLEFGWGIPGTVGGAVINNAGSKGEWILDYVEKIRFLTSNGEEGTINRGQIISAYRFSGLKHEDRVITEVFLKLVKKDKQEIKKSLEEFAGKRKHSQPLDMPSAGSVFKNPKGCFAANLIEESGCKGLREGGVMVSNRHANFIVNVGGGKAKEVLSLIKTIRERVKTRFGVNLELEIELVGF
ncbi:MAG: UDP-N-acetylmuramate dehydrogenase [Candidatus Saganbacteria bacterium]|nr:UDP-N-acetylmuramate dehydrogenase [Candidatus Saganbacteria bacterium]